MARKGKKRSGGHGGKGKGQGGAPREKKKTADQLEGPVVTKSKGGSTSPVPGLSNLGNTCFFNAVMQCIGQSHYFIERLKLHIQSPTFSCELMLPTTRSCTSGDNPDCRSRETWRADDKTKHILGQMQEGGGRTLNPKPVFSEICRKAPRFSSYHQQDSQELLRYLLDSLRSEEVYRVKKALLLSYNVNSGKAKVTEEDRKEIRQYGIQAQLARTFVDDVFAGRLVSTVVCQECGNCSTIHETFLDLSLPIADDKGMQGQQSGGRDQKKSKGGGKTGFSNRGGDKVVERENSPSLPTDKMSRHQLQKAKKQREKAAKKEAKFKAKKQKSLQEFLSGSNDVQEEQTLTELMTNTEADAESENGTVTQSLKSEGEIINVASHCQKSLVDQADSADISSPTDNHNVDPATGECKRVTTDTKEADPNALNTQDSTFLDYASAGPQPDQTDIAEMLEGIVLDDNNSPNSFGVEEGQGENSKENNELVNLPDKADTIPPADLEGLQVATDSLEGSLKRFCTPELLTGSNKFACVLCTEARAERSVSMEEEVAEEGNGESDGRIEREERGQTRPMEIGVDDKAQPSQATQCDCEKEMPQQPIKVEESTKTEDFTQRDESHHTIQVEDSTLTESAAAPVDSSVEPTLPHGREDKVEGDSAVSSLISEEQTHNAGEHGEDLSGDVSVTSPNSVERELDRSETDDELPLLEDDESEDGEEKTAEEQSNLSSTVVFSEATKQFLIGRLPSVLTLNLKRFIQHGRRLQKNSRHISFPTILNVAPFCTDSCKVGCCDRKGQLLYSLYGVVEHSGGMQGGHYTAYVRTRTPLKLDKSKIMSNPESGGGQRLSDESAADVGANEASEATAAVGCKFDLSSRGGQWYFISDSHVRTATESEMLKSQAYLLFYEQLPLSRD